MYACGNPRPSSPHHFTLGKEPRLFGGQALVLTHLTFKLMTSLLVESQSRAWSPEGSAV